MVLRFHAWTLLAIACCAEARAQPPSSPRPLVPTTLHVSAEVGERKQLISAPCVKAAAGTEWLKIEQGSNASGQFLAYTPRSEDGRKVTINALLGTGAPASVIDCVASEPISIEVTTSDVPTVSNESLGTAFNVLVAAFVLALLMESAFAMLFNWRVFQEFFVGRSWRTLIMFLVSLTVVRQFHLDLLATVFEAYNANSKIDASESWTTSVLTAMIIGGGSAGVNRILVTLGFRSHLPKIEEEKQLLVKRNLAYISVRIIGSSHLDQFRVNVVEDHCGDVPIMLGIINRSEAPTLKALLFPDRGRFPRSGGYALDASLCYRLSVTDLRSSAVFDTDGHEVASEHAAKVYRFMAGAIIDFDISIR